MRLFDRELKSEEQSFFVAVLTVVTWLIVTFLTRPESKETLQAFYRQIRPSRWGWGPIAAETADVQADQDLGFRIVASIVGSVEVFLVIQAVGDWILGSYLRASFLTLFAIVGGLVLNSMVTRITRPHAGQSSERKG